MSVGKGSIKRAAGVKPEVKAEPAKKPAAKAPAKKAAAKKPATKKATTSAKKPAAPNKQMPIANSTAGVHYGLGNELPIFLM